MEFRPLQTYHDRGNEYYYGYLKSLLPKNIVDELELIYQDILKNKPEDKRYNHYLAGEIENEFYVNFSEEFNKYIIDLAQHFEYRSNGYIKITSDRYPISTLEPDAKGVLPLKDMINKRKDLKSYDIPDLELVNGWINLQKKYEFNPMHNHGGILSFVIWHRIPYFKEEEISVSPGRFKNSYNPVGDFCFYHYDGRRIMTENIPVDNNWDGVIAMFPSDLYHSVYPFYTSDDYRVTFSGNLYLKDEKTLIDFKFKK